MVELWFAIASVTLALYVVLDGFDFGAGALHLFVARSDPERRQVLAAIGPYWDGNEVWLLAGGGVLFLAFPRVLASGLSGFYFAIFLVLWALILRGISIEFRSHLDRPLWRAAWDAVFSVSSGLLAVLFGAALGNLVRGLPIGEDGWFSLSLFTDFSAASPVGILDWFTISAGVFSLAALCGHGATFLAWKTDGAVHERSRGAALRFYAAVTVLWPLLTGATWMVNPRVLSVLPQRPLALVLVVVAIAGLANVWRGLSRRRELQAFLGSCAFLVGMLAATAACVFPVMLRSVIDERWSLTAHNSSVPVENLAIALRWWILAFPLALFYCYTVFRLHRGKAVGATGHDGY
jgi:cytochrome bd ubiquinol oxidase subunit II